MTFSFAQDRSPSGSLFRRVVLLWLAGLAMRISILAVPPVIPLIHDELRMSETAVGLLMGLPLVLFAVAAVPGSLLVARLGNSATLMLGMLVAGLAAAARGGAGNVAMLYAATIVMGFGVAITQPAVPALVREWMPDRLGLGTSASTNGMLVGVTLPSALTISLVLPALGGSWRLSFLVWAAPVLATALLFGLAGPRSRAPAKTAATLPAGWWPDWKSPLTWMLGLAFGANNSVYFTTNAFLPDYLASAGEADRIGAALAWLNGSQLLASFVLIPLADRVLQRGWPYLVFAPLSVAALVGILLLSGPWVVAAAGIVGFSTSVTFVMILAAPPILSPRGQVHRTAAGMFTIAYTCGVLIPTISGSLWDASGRPWTAFVPIVACAAALTGLGVALSRCRPAED